MIGFIVPVKAKNKSKNWDQDNVLLKNTIQSLCNQASPEFKIFVVYTDMPFFVDSTKVVYVHYPFPYILATDLDDYEEVVKPQFSDAMGAGVFDKGKRVAWGCAVAKEHGCKYVMSVDSDDFVSNRLAEYVQKHSDEKYGWFANKGYIWNGNYPILIRVAANMHHLNGSTNIVNIDLMPSISFGTKKLGDVAFLIMHGYLKDRIFAKFKETIKPLPFYAIIYLLHNSNWADYRRMMSKDSLKTFVKYLIRGKWLSKTIKSEFGISK